MRCPWAEVSAADTEYHDREWGVPVREEARLFEMLTLEGAQAGLSWSTILKKREGYRSAFAGFDPAKVARIRAAHVERLVNNPAIVRHRGKIESTIHNARAVLRLREKGDSLAELLWSFVDDAPITNRWRTIEEVPAATETSRGMSRELKTARVPVCGTDNLLRADAGGRPCERSPLDLLPPLGSLGQRRYSNPANQPCRKRLSSTAVIGGGAVQRSSASSTPSISST